MDQIGKDRYTKILKGKNIFLYEPDDCLFILITDLLQFYGCTVWKVETEKMEVCRADTSNANNSIECADIYIINVESSPDGLYKLVDDSNIKIHLCGFPAIAITKPILDGDFHKLTRCGFTSILTVPFTAEELLDQIYRSITTHQAATKTFIFDK